MKLSIIIVNYNVKYFLEQALWSVRKASKNIAIEIFVVDNNSVDDSVQMVQTKFPEVKLIANKENSGFSTANNQAIRIAQGEYILLLNPDTVVEEDTFEKCIQFMDAKKDAGALGVKMIDGSGEFLPESKRGFPSPLVAFSKTFGLSKLFPKSKTFNHYHLAYLDENEIHEIEVLAGAFFLVRKSVLDEIGLLDEAFFMYGEDIDLSYRIIKAGYKNYYFPETKIIHYKGESTKKGSLNYVKVFYNAMIIFAKKHFTGEKAWMYILMLQLAIYFRASLTVVTNTFKKLYLPILDALSIFGGMWFLKDFWARNYFNDPNYYQDSLMSFNVPMYISIWIGAIYFSGAYDDKWNLRRLVRGVLVGTFIIAAVYGFLEMEYRTSRVLIVLGAVWTIFSTITIRGIIHFLKFKNLNIGNTKTKNTIIVGSKEESDRVLNLMLKAQINNNFIGIVSPKSTFDNNMFLSSIEQLFEVVNIYKIDEIIFCSKDLSAQKIMHWMTSLGTDLAYKIVPEESLSIIGSPSKNSSGELYTIDIQFQIAQFMNQRNKRLLDILLSIMFLITSPILILFVKSKINFIQNIFKVLFGQKTWVGYTRGHENYSKHLPKIKQGVLSPIDELNLKDFDHSTIQRLNFLYARDFTPWRDLGIILKAIKKLGLN